MGAAGTRKGCVVSEKHEQWDIVSSVGVTAVAVAAGRAVETLRRHPLSRDPFAESLVQAAAPPVAMPTRPAALEGRCGFWACVGASGRPDGGADSLF